MSHSMQERGEHFIAAMASKRWPASVRFTVASICLGVVVLSWVLEAELLQGLQGTDSSDYSKPYFLTYVMSAVYSLFLLAWLPSRLYEQVHRQKRGIGEALKPINLFDAEDRYILKTASIISLPYFLCGLTWYVSLPQTSVSANTAIYDSSFVFVFLLSAVFLNDGVSLLKVLSVLLCFIGVVVVASSSSSSDEDGIDQTAFGYLALVISTVLYAAYEVAFKMYGQLPKDKQKQAADDEEAGLALLTTDIQGASGERKEQEKVSTRGALTSTFLFMGVIGVSTVAFYWPGIIVVDLLGIEPFVWPDAAQWQQIGINIVFDMLLNISLLIGITLTTPLFMAVGSLLTMPVSVCTDWIFHDYVLPVSAFFGMLAIVTGFVLLNVAEVFIQKDGASKLPHSDHIAVKLCCGFWRRKPDEAGLSL